MAKKKCYSCSNEKLDDGSIYICYNCSNNKIYKTDIIKNFKLSNDDLIGLNCGYCNYKSNICTYYYKPDILNIVIQKYGYNYEEKFIQEKQNKNNIKNNRINERQKKIMQYCFNNDIDYNKYLSIDVVKKYISSGKNITKVLSYISKVDNKNKILKENLVKYNLKKDNYYCFHYIWGFYYGEDEYIDDDLLIISNINNLIKKLKNMKINKIILETKLFLNGLTFRDDSKLYASFIDGKSIYSLNDIIKIMKEMEFLYNNTNYASILKDIRYNYIKELRTYGYYEHSEYDEEIVRDRAKYQVYKNIKKPDFSIII